MSKSAAIGLLLAMLSSASLAEDIEGKTVNLTLGKYLPMRIDKPFKTILISDPKVVDLLAQTDKAVILHPLASGATTVMFLDADNLPIYNLDVVVTDAGPGRVTVHNKALVSSYTSYRCWTAGCEYAGETTVQEPAPLPPVVTRNEQTLHQDTTISRQGPLYQAPPYGLPYAPPY
jgi:hypothetical protein